MADFVLTVPQDASLALTQNNGGSVVVDPVPASSFGGGLPAGSYPGQPVAWDPDLGAYVPSPELRVSNVGTPTQQLGLVAAYSTGPFAEVAMSAIDLDALNPVAVATRVFGPEDAEIVLGIGSSSPIRVQQVAGVFRLGFFNAAPVVRPTIAGGTTQQQVDSLKAALVALGLVNP